MGPAKKRGILARWLHADEQAQHYHPTPAQTQSSKGKEREWDAGELDEDMQKIMNSVIFNGGLDFETRPMVVMTAAALPNPDHVDYDVLLQLILEYLDLYVEADYCVVFLAAGGRFSPGWSWIWKAYRSLSRKYRKNLKKLYIVHSTGFSKMLFSLAGAIISPKFYAKLEYISTLSDLAKHVPLSQINIHPAVYAENLKFEREITLPTSQQPATSVFGASLDEIMGMEGESGGVPRPVRDAIAYLRAWREDDTIPLEDKGLFRRSPSSALLKQVQAAYDRGQVVDLSQYNDANLCAVLIKKFFRALPQPIFLDSMFAMIRNCPNPDNPNTRDDAVEYIKTKIIGELEGNKQILLNVVLHLLHDVAARSSVNLMDAYNLAIVFTPNLVSNDNPLRAVQMSMVASPTTQRRGSKDIMMQNQPQPDLSDPHSPTVAHNTTLGTVIRVCIEDYYEIFDEVRDVTEAVPGELLEANGTIPNPISLPISAEVTAPLAANKGKPAAQMANMPSSPNAASTSPMSRAQGRTRGPPPSSATTSMALLAQALAKDPSNADRNTQVTRSNKSRALLDPQVGESSQAYQESRDGAAGSRTPYGSRSVAYNSHGPSGSGWTGTGLRGMPKTRSIISIEKAPPVMGVDINPSGHGKGKRTITSGRESINLGRATITSGGTVRKSASAGVVGVGVTATGFFAPP